jgi:hypothetical protein
MAKILMVKYLNALRPVDEADCDLFDKLKQNVHVLVDIKQQRHLKFFRLYWVLMQVVWTQSQHDRWPTKEELSDAVKVMAGLRNPIFLPDGNVVYRPGSIAFHNMDELTFAAFFDRVCDVIARDFLPGITSETLYEEVSFIVGAAFMPKRIAA